MEEKFEVWALLELMGHNKIAGKVSEHKFGNTSMIRVDVPQVGEIPAFTKFLSVNALYAINPITEKDALEYATMLKKTPLDVWDMQTIFEAKIEELVRKGQLARPELAESNNPFDEDEEDQNF